MTQVISHQPTKSTSTAQLIIKEIHDGSCIQLGIGALPNLIGQMIADSDLKHLGVHTKCWLIHMWTCMKQVVLMEAEGNRPKKMVYCFALGTQKLYDFIDLNPACAIYPVLIPTIKYCCSNPNLVCINNCLEIDLFGQVASEAVGVVILVELADNGILLRPGSCLKVAKESCVYLPPTGARMAV